MEVKITLEGDEEVLWSFDIDGPPEPGSKYTWQEVIDELIKDAARDFCESSVAEPEIANNVKVSDIGRMMQEVAHEIIHEGGDPTGDVFPGFDDEVPVWVLKRCGIIKL